MKEFIRKSPGIRKFIRKVLETPLIKNPLYKHLYYANVRNKITTLEERPLTITIENTNHCNYMCNFCFHPEMNRDRGYMDWLTFISVIDDAAEWGVPGVLLQGFGEPLLDKNYFEKVRYVKRRGIECVYCATNGSLLTPFNVEEIINSGLDYISISIDAYNNDRYTSIHGNGELLKVIIGVNELIYNRDSRKPYIQLRFKEAGASKQEIKEFIKYFKGRVDEIIIYQNIVNWVGTKVKGNIPDGGIKMPCYNLWATLFVLWDGKVTMCCHDYDGLNIIGDVKEQRIKDIWHGSKLRKERERHLKGKFEGICEKCSINLHYLNPWWS